MDVRKHNMVFLLFLMMLCGTFLLTKGELLADMNPDLEIDSTDPEFVWKEHKPCDFETVDDSFTGLKSLKVTNRKFDYSSPRLTLKKKVLRYGHSYFYSVHVKYLNNPPGLANFNVSLVMRLNKIGVANDFVYVKIGLLNFQRAGTGWQRVGGDFRMPTEAERDYRIADFYVQLPREVEYLFDAASMIELVRQEPGEWKTRINAKIQRERTNSITLTATIPQEYNLTNMEIKVDQVSSPFKFGSALRVDDFINTDSNFSEAYRNFFYENFDMAVLENAMKWKNMVFKKGVYRSARVDTFLNMMKENSVPVRAHTILWGTYKSQPRWLLDYPAATIRSEVDSWIDWVCQHYQNRFVHWDVYNEYLQSHVYEDILGDEEYIMYIFSRVAARCTGHLYLNDYNVLRSGQDTMGQYNLAKRLQAADVGLTGIGAQTHIKPKFFDVQASIEFIENRLKLLCELGLPVSVTELSVHHDDVEVRASKLDEVLRLLYSEPCVQSVLYWGFSDQNNFEADSVLTEGIDVQPNAAGDVWCSLTQEEWKTHDSFKPTSSQLQRTIVGHHGDHVVTVTYNGEEIVTSSFSLTKGHDVSLNLDFP